MNACARNCTTKSATQPNGAPSGAGGGKVGYLIGRTYTSLTGFFAKTPKPSVPAAPPPNTDSSRASGLGTGNLEPRLL